MIVWTIVVCVFFSVFFIVLSMAVGFKTVSQSVKGNLDEGSDVLALPLGRLIAFTSTLFTGDIWRSIVASNEEKLVQAGNPGGKLSGAQFLAVLLLASFGIWLFNFLILIAIGGFSPIAIIFPLFFGVATFILGYMWLNSLIVDRKKFLTRDFPYFIDMSVMVMGAGATFQQAIKIYLRENPTGALSSELTNVSSEIDFGKSLVEALSGMEERIETTGVKNALKALIQSLKMGTPINESLIEQAEAMRFMRSQVAERVAEEMKIRMQGPAMLLLVSVLILILGPAAVNLKDSGMF